MRLMALPRYLPGAVGFGNIKGSRFRVSRRHGLIGNRGSTPFLNSLARNKAFFTGTTETLPTTPRALSSVFEDAACGGVVAASLRKLSKDRAWPGISVEIAAVRAKI